MDDTISRQATIDAICTDCCGTSNADCKNPFDPATDDYYYCDGCVDVELIKALPSADVPQWIPVTDRYPEPNTMVLASYDGDDIAWCYYDGNPEEYVFDAWMPLPEAYKEVTE